MERDALNDFVVLSEVLSFSEAAEKLHLSQSALSKRIKALETELGEELFIRSTRKIALSDFGLAFLPYARQILTGYASADLFLDHYHSAHAKSITLGSIRNPQCYGIDKIFSGFQKAYPEIRMELAEGRLEELENLFRIGKINLYCTCNVMVHEKNTHFIPVGTGRLGAVIPADDTLSRKIEITIKDLAKKPLLLPSESSPFYALIMSQFQAMNITPSIVYKGGAISSIYLVRSGMGIAIQPVEIVRDFLSDRTVLTRIIPEISYSFGLGCRDKKDMTRAEILFVNYLKEHFALSEDKKK